MIKIWLSKKLLVFYLSTFCCLEFQINKAYATEDETAFRIGKTDVKVKDLYQENQGKFYTIEMQKFQIIEELARERYLSSFWNDLAIRDKTTTSEARDEYLKKHAQVKEEEVAQVLKKLKNHQRLASLSKKDQKEQITEYLKSVKTRELIDRILAEAISQKRLTIVYSKPIEPIYNLTINESDPIRFGPNATDTKAVGCAIDCPLTVVEYCEFQCPFCSKALSTVKTLLSEYQGKIRWIVRDFPLGFHSRARSAALAARCSFEQGKYWEMYEILYQNQRSFSDADLQEYAKAVGLNLNEFTLCLEKPEKVTQIIDENYRSGEAMGVTDTPAYFINGRKLSGILPYEEFKRTFDEELRKKGK